MSLNTEVGGATANSYVSLASANSYFLTRENSDGWTGMVGVNSTLTATARKEGLLKQAVREIDTLRFQCGKYNPGYVGASDYQALEFPRSSNTDANGELYIPIEVKVSEYEQAMWILERGSLKTNAITGYDFASPIIGTNTKSNIKGWVDRIVSKSGSFKESWTN